MDQKAIAELMPDQVLKLITEQKQYTKFKHLRDMITEYRDLTYYISPDGQVHPELTEALYNALDLNRRITHDSLKRMTENVKGYILNRRAQLYDQITEYCEEHRILEGVKIKIQ